MTFLPVGDALRAPDTEVMDEPSRFRAVPPLPSPASQSAVPSEAGGVPVPSTASEPTPDHIEARSRALVGVM